MHQFAKGWNVQQVIATVFQRKRNYWNLKKVKSVVIKFLIGSIR